MKKIVFLLILISVSLTAAQTKYLIYFKDKGVSPAASLHKSSALFKIAEKELSPQAIERRKQVMGEDNYITYEDIPLNENYTHKIEQLGIKIENKLKWFNAVSCYLTDAQINQLKNLSCIEKIERVRVSKSRTDENQLINRNNSVQQLNKISSPTSLNYGPSLTQNALSDIPVVHDLGIKGTGVLIGILDTGFRWKTHPSLKNNKVLNERDFVQNDNVTENQTGDRSDQDSHGTAVFSLMAGNDPGNIIGPAYDASFILAKTEYVPTETHVEEDNYAAALEWMEGLGVQITSSSLGYNEFDSPQTSYTFANMDGKTTIVAKAANLAFDRGVSTFTAAGNERGNSWNHIISPADAFNMIAVGSVTLLNTISSFSSPGPTSDGRIKPEVVAMGSNDYHAVAGGSYGTGSGTSYATPIAAGIAGLLKSAWTHLTNVQIRKIFIECGDRATAPDNNYGYGLISAKRVVSYPNLSQTNNVYNVLNKIFIDANGVNFSSVRLNYQIGGALVQSVPMSYDGTLKYNYTLPTSTNGDSVKFYFQYQTISGSTVKEPSVGIYIFSYGDLMVYYKSTQEIVQQIPSQYQLNQNYPNPFNPSTIISYQLSVAGFVTLKIYDVLGREITTLVNEFQLPGTYNSTFSILHSALSSGVYFYRLQTDNFAATKKMMLLK
jgi:hypothetical protein